MPWRRGVSRAQYNNAPGLTAAQQQALESIVDDQGLNEGIQATYQRVLDQMGNNAPTRREVAEFLAPRPHYQQNKLRRKDRIVAPVIPKNKPLSLVGIDTFMMPNSAHRDAPNHPWRSYRACIIVQCSLTKWVYVAPCQLGVEKRPHAQVALNALIEFRRIARIETHDPALQIGRLLSDAGSEWKSVFAQWVTTEGIEHVHSVASKSAANGTCERAVQSWRRYAIGHYKATARAWERANTPMANRTYDFVSHIDEISRRYNTKWHRIIKGQPIKAIRLNELPSYQDCYDNIVQYARKTYGGRAIDGAIQVFSSAGRVPVGTLCRVVKYKGGGGVARLTWDNIGKTSADNFSQQIYRVQEVIPGRGWKETQYVLEDLSGNRKSGNYDRAQFVTIPDATLGFVTESESEDEESEDDGESEAEPENAVLPRPAVGINRHRYDAGDVLMFDAQWTHEPRIPGPRRAREGRVTRAYTARIAGEDALAYSIRFTLQNGRHLTREYEAKPLVDPDEAEPDEAIDTSAFIQYMHTVS